MTYFRCSSQLYSSEMHYYFNDHSCYGDQMHCSRCHSPRIIRFLDGFGDWRIFCRSCLESTPITEMNTNKNVKKITEFTSRIMSTH